MIIYQYQLLVIGILLIIIYCIQLKNFYIDIIKDPITNYRTVNIERRRNNYETNIKKNL